MPRWRSWLLIHLLHSDVNKLLRARDAEGLLRLLAEVSDPQQPGWISKRAIIATALGELQTRAAVPRLAPLLDRDERPDVRGCAAIALSHVGGPDAAEALRPLLDDPNPRIRLAAIAGAALDDRDALADLVAIARTDQQELVRSAALEALARTKDERWIPLYSAAAATDTIAPLIAGIVALIDLKSVAADEAIRQLRRTSDGRAERFFVALFRLSVAISRPAHRRRKRQTTIS